MEIDALIKHLEELRICAQKCNDDGAGPIAVEAELVRPFPSRALQMSFNKTIFNSPKFVCCRIMCAHQINF